MMVVLFSILALGLVLSVGRKKPKELAVNTDIVLYKGLPYREMGQVSMQTEVAPDATPARYYEMPSIEAALTSRNRNCVLVLKNFAIELTMNELCGMRDAMGLRMDYRGKNFFMKWAPDPWHTGFCVGQLNTQQCFHLSESMVDAFARAVEWHRQRDFYSHFHPPFRSL